MPSLREYFLTESAEYLDRLDRLSGAEDADPAEVLRNARALRGAAQMAREDSVQRLAVVLESAAREVQSGERAWDADLRNRVGETIADLRELVRVGEEQADDPARLEAALRRWSKVGVSAAPAPAAPGADLQEELRRYVDAEVQLVIEELDRAVPALQSDPTGRDPLKAILRRQRAVLGAAGLEGFPILAEALQVVEDATRAIARRNLAVDGEWLTLYRESREVLAEASADATGTAESHKLQQLRALRSRLIGGSTDSEPPRPPGPPPTDDPVEVINFFQAESAKLLDRIERLAGAYAAGAEDRRVRLREDLRNALSALRDTARTFGFEDPAREVDAALARLGDEGAAGLLGIVEDLRQSVAEATGPAGGTPSRAPSHEEAASSRPALEATPAEAPAMARVDEIADVPPSRPASSAEPAPAPDDTVTPIDEFLYRGDRALERALELRGRLEVALRHEDGDAREALDELFDLVRLAMS